MISDNNMEGVNKYNDERRYILISDLASETPYSQAYLSLLARRGRIDAKKIGRNWHVSPEGLQEYLIQQGIPVFIPKAFPSKSKLRRPLDPSLVFTSMPPSEEMGEMGERGEPSPIPRPALIPQSPPAPATPPVPELPPVPLTEIKREEGVKREQGEERVEREEKGELGPVEEFRVSPEKFFQKKLEAQRKFLEVEADKRARLPDGQGLEQTVEAEQTRITPPIQTPPVAKREESDKGVEGGVEGEKKGPAEATDLEKTLEKFVDVLDKRLSSPRTRVGRTAAALNQLSAATMGRPSRWLMVFLVTIVVIGFVFGGFGFGSASALIYKARELIKDATTLQGHTPGTHANEVLLLDKEGKISIYGHIETKGQLRSYVEEGIAPIVVDSTTTVENLSADYLDNVSAEEFTLAFVTKNGSVTTEKVFLEGGVEVGETLLVKSANKLAQAIIEGNLSTLGSISIGKDLVVNGFSTLAGGADIFTRLLVRGDAEITNLVVAQRGQIKEGGLMVSGHTQLNTLGVSGGASINNLGVGDFNAGGDVFLGNSTADKLVVNASSTFKGTVNLAEDIFVMGSVRFGDSDSDNAEFWGTSIGFNSSATNTISVATGLNFDSGTLVLDARANRVGVGTSSPGTLLAVAGTGNIQNDLTVGGILKANNVVTASTTLASGFGTTSPYALLSVEIATSTKLPAFVVHDQGTSSPAFAVFPNNFVGLSTSTPGTLFAVQGSANVGSLTVEGPLKISSFTSTSSDNSFIRGALGIGTSSPGAALGVKGAGILEGFVSADYFTSTSTNNSWLLGQLGIGTTSPGTRLDVAGSGLIKGNFTAEATSSVSSLIATSTLEVRGASGSDLIIQDGRVGIGTSTAGQLLAVAGTGLFQNNLTAESAFEVQGTATFNAQTWSGDITASTGGVDIASAGTRLGVLYADEVNATTLVGTISGGNVSAATLSINSDNATADTEDSNLAFERGTVTPNALLTWHAGNDQLETNAGLFIYREIDSADNAGYALDAVGAGRFSTDLDIMGGDINLGTGSATTTLTVSAAGALTVGNGATSTPAINFLSDPDTGITSGGDDNMLSFITGGAMRATIDKNGLVGIGTSTPTILRTTSYTPADPNTIPLIVQGVNNTDAFFTVYARGSRDAGISFVSDERGGVEPIRDNVEKWRIYNDANTDTLYIGSQDNLQIIGLEQTDIARFGFNDILFSSRLTQATATTSINNSYGFNLFTNGSGGVSLTGTDQFGMFLDMHGSSAATSQAVAARIRAGTAVASFTTRLAAGLQVLNPEEGAGSTIDKAVGLQIQSITAGNSNFAIETQGTTQSLFGGNILTVGDLDIYGGDLNLGTGSATTTLTSASGLLGIASTSPGNLLDVAGSGLFKGGLYVQATTTTSSLIATSTLEVRGAGGSDLMVNDGQVGVGVADPVTLLHIRKAAFGGTLPADGDPNRLFIMESNDTTLWAIYTPNNQQGGLVFADPQDSEAGSIRYNHSTNSLLFRTNGVGSRVVIDSNGYLGVGTVAPSQALEVTTAGLFGTTLDVGTDLQIYGGDINLGTGSATTTLTSSSGNLGIGTTTPGALLSVQGASNVGSLTVEGVLKAGTLTATSSIQNAAGSTSSPAYSFTTDTDTGITSGGADNMLSLVTGGSARVTIDKNGSVNMDSNTLFVDGVNNRVGIGTTTPTSTLDVVGGIRLASYDGQANIIVDNAGASTPHSQILFRRKGSNFGVIRADATDTTMRFNIGGVDPDNPDLILTSNRRLGVGGRTSPDTALDVVGAGTFSTDLNVLGGDINLGTGSATTTITSSGGRLGIASTTPFGLLSVEMNSLVDQDRPAFVVGDTGTSSPALLVDYAGNVGIGTASPGAGVASDVKLHIRDGAGNSTGFGGNHDKLIIEDDDYAYININSLNTGAVWFTDATAQAGGIVYDHTINRLGFVANADPGTPKMVLTSAGNVGIGTTSPSDNLHVEGTFPQIQLRGSSGEGGGISFYHGLTDNVNRRNWDIVTESATVGSIQFRYSSSKNSAPSNTALLITNSGLVGIGTTTPGTRLDVAGDGLIKGALTVEGVLKASTLSATSSIQVGAGSTSSPAYSFTTDTDTGITSGGADNMLSLITGGSVRAVIDKNGNVGIGTANPTYKLEISGAAGLGGGLKFDNTSDALNDWTLRVNAAGDFIFRDDTGANDEVVITTSGNVGIGTTTPGTNYKLDVYDSGGSMKFGNSAPSSAFTIDTGTDSYLNINTGGTIVIRVSANGGNVGIGTTSPTSLLHVNNSGAAGADSRTATFNYSGITGRGISLGLDAVNIPTISGIVDGANSSSLKLRTKNAGTIIDAITIDGPGNVGIGTSTPGALLSLKGGFLANATSTIEGYGLIANAVFSTSTLGFYTNSNATPRVQIDSSGNVGIGTASPDTKLDVHGIALFNNDASPVANGGLRIVAPIASTHYNWMIGAQENVGAALEITPSTVVGGTSFSTPVAVFTQGGNVGIGTTTPGTLLNINGIVNGEIFTAENHIKTGYIIATSTTNNTFAGAFDVTEAATSTFTGGIGALSLNTGNGITTSGDIIGTGKLDITKILAGAGSTSSPAYSFTTDTDTGITSGGADNMLSLITGGSVRAVIDKTGNVGIGTTSPGTKLHLASEAGSDVYIRLSDEDVIHGFTSIVPSNVFGRIETNGTLRGGLFIAGLNDDGTGPALTLVGDLGSADPADTVAAVEIKGRKLSGSTIGNLGDNETAFQIVNNTTPVVSVLGGGNVGIGTTDPSQALEVSTTGRFGTTLDVGTDLQVYGGDINLGTGSATSTLTSSGGLLGLASTTPWGLFSIEATTDVNSRNPIFVVGDAGTTTPFLYVSGNNGNVGIGTASPGYKLHVVGSNAYDTTAQINTTTTNANQTPLAVRTSLTSGSPAAGLASTIMLQAGSLGSEVNQAYIQTEWVDSSNHKLHIANRKSNSLTPSVTIDNSGNLGIASTTPRGRLGIEGASTTPALLIRAGNTTGDGAIAISVASGDLCDDNGTPAGCALNDIAELFPTEAGIKGGDVVAFGSGLKLTKASTTNALAGVISTAPAIVIEGNRTIALSGFYSAGSGKAPLALSGRVPVKIASTSPAIAAGDFLTVASDAPGLAAKAAEAGYTIGKALEAYDPANPPVGGKISMFVNLTYYAGSPESITNSIVTNNPELISDNSGSNSGLIRAITGTLSNLWKVTKSALASITNTLYTAANSVLASSTQLAVSSEDAETITYETYNLQSTRGELIASGSATLVMMPESANAVVYARIRFDESFTSLIDETEPIKVIVTPTTKLNGGLYVHEKSPYGFEVREINAQDEGGMFDWIVIARTNANANDPSTTLGAGANTIETNTNVANPDTNDTNTTDTTTTTATTTTEITITTEPTPVEETATTTTTTITEPTDTSTTTEPVITEPEPEPTLEPAPETVVEPAPVEETTTTEPAPVEEPQPTADQPQAGTATTTPTP